jgi:hypothetical protein
MHPKLRLVRDPHKRETARVEEEDRFRYPARDEIWEVSCEGEWDGEEKPTRGRDQRRAS